MKLILQQDVKSLGKKGDILEVSEGYARNYLLPKSLAIPATNENVNIIKQKKSSEAHKQQKLLEEAKLLACQLNKVALKLSIKIGEGGRVFGSITSKDIADVLEAQYGLVVDKRKIELKEAIKKLGAYSVNIKLHPDVSSAVGVNVVGK